MPCLRQQKCIYSTFRLTMTGPVAVRAAKRSFGGMPSRYDFRNNKIIFLEKVLKGTVL